MEWYDENISVIERTTPFSMVNEQNWQWTWDFIFGVCKYLVIKLTDYFFTIIGKQTWLQKNIIYCHKQNCKLTRRFGTMYIDIDDYPSYTDTISSILEKNIFPHSVISWLLLFNSQRHHGHMDQQQELGNVETLFYWIFDSKQTPKTTVWSICRYVDDLRQQSNNSLYFSPDKEHTFSESLKKDKYIVDVETI